MTRRRFPFGIWPHASGSADADRSDRRGLRPDPVTMIVVLERPLVVDRDVDLRDRLAGRHPGEELLRHLGQERAGQDVVDVAGAALDLLAAAGDVGDEVVAVAELRPCGSPSSAGRSGRAGAG